MEKNVRTEIPKYKKRNVYMRVRVEANRPFSWILKFS